MSFRDFLTENGYILTDSGQNWRCSAVFRGGKNRSALSICKKNGLWSDFVSGASGNFAKLVALTLGKEVSKEEISKIINEFQIELEEIEEEKVETEKVYPEEDLKRLTKNYSYYLKKGISRETLSKFRCGVAEGGALYQRMVFPIYNEQGKIHGLQGRDVTGKKEDAAKWKKLGQSKNWVHAYIPGAGILEEIRHKKEIILVESIGDQLAVYEAGFKNVVPTFGTKLGSKLISFIAKENLTVIIASNNDIDNEKDNPGLLFAYEIYMSLCSVISPNKIIAHLPPSEEDFGEMIVSNPDSIQEWYENRYYSAQNQCPFLYNMLDFFREQHKIEPLSKERIRIAKQIKEYIENEYE